MSKPPWHTPIKSYQHSKKVGPSRAEMRATIAAAARNTGWQPINTAPKDGTVIDLTWMDDGVAQEIWPCQWCHIQRNGMFPGKVGMWTVPDGSITWNDDDKGGGPTHWRSRA